MTAETTPTWEQLRAENAELKEANERHFESWKVDQAAWKADRDALAAAVDAKRALEEAVGRAIERCAYCQATLQHSNPEYRVGVCVMHKELADLAAATPSAPEKGVRAQEIDRLRAALTDRWGAAHVYGVAWKKEHPNGLILNNDHSDPIETCRATNCERARIALADVDKGG